MSQDEEVTEAWKITAHKIPLAKTRIKSLKVVHFLFAQFCQFCIKCPSTKRGFF